MHVDVVEGDTNIWYQVVDDDNKYFLKQTYICTLRKVYIYIHTDLFTNIDIDQTWNLHLLFLNSLCVQALN